MPTNEKRISVLETACPPRCQKCRTKLTCPECWKLEAKSFGLDPTALTDSIAQIVMAMQKNEHENIFAAFGYDINKLTVEELRTLRFLLGKAAGESHAETTP